MKKTWLNWLVCASLISVLIACESDSKNARLEVWLTDAPGDYQQVNIDIQGIEIHASENGNGNNGLGESANVVVLWNDYKQSKIGGTKNQRNVV